jgi:hypothetical protein
MKSSRPLCFLILTAVLSCAACHVSAADSPELVEARSRLLEAYQSGQTDNDNQVKQLRAKINALEYVAAAKATMGAASHPPLISVDFPGGPASALVNAISKTDRDNSFNVIGEKADLAIELPAFSVRNADPASLATSDAELLASLQDRSVVMMRRRDGTNEFVLVGQ